MSEQEILRRCKTCKEELLEDARFCKECNSWQGKQCVNCKQRLPDDANLCNGCGKYQKGWRSLFPFSQNVLSLLVALVAVISPAVTATLYLLDRPSNTKFKASGADDKHIYLKVWNTGKLPSTLVGYHLILGGQLPIKDIELDLTDQERAEGMNLISSASPVTIALVVIDRDWLPKPDHPEGYTRDEFKQYEEKQVTLKLDIEESSGKISRTENFPIRWIGAFLCGGCRDAKP